MKRTFLPCLVMLSAIGLAQPKIACSQPAATVDKAAVDKMERIDQQALQMLKQVETAYQELEMYSDTTDYRVGLADGTPVDGTPDTANWRAIIFFEKPDIAILAVTDLRSSAPDTTLVSSDGKTVTYTHIGSKKVTRRQSEVPTGEMPFLQVILTTLVGPDSIHLLAGTQPIIDAESNSLKSLSLGPPAIVDGIWIRNITAEFESEMEQRHTKSTTIWSVGIYDHLLRRRSTVFRLAGQEPMITTETHRGVVSNLTSNIALPIDAGG